jgi:hypothetical protein
MVAGAAAGIAVVVSCDATPQVEAQGMTESAVAEHHHQPPPPPRPERVITADTDPNQLVAGALNAPYNVSTLLTSGPLVITDLQIDFGPSGWVTFELWSKPTAQGCDGNGERIWLGGGPISVHGARIPVPAGRNLCLSTSQFNSVIPANVAWSGFKSY